MVVITLAVVARQELQCYNCSKVRCNMYMGFGRVYLRDIMHEGEKAWIKQVRQITVQIMSIRIKQAAGRR